MKRFFALAAAALLLCSFSGCAGKTADSTSGAGDAMTLDEIADSIVSDIPDMPALMSTALTEENFTYYSFAPFVEGVEGLASEPMIGSIPHSVVLLRAPDNAAAEALAEDIEANMNLRKWICVEAEKGIVTVHNSTVLLVMSSEAVADAAAANFDALWA